jgi:hypothetical protein
MQTHLGEGVALPQIRGGVLIPRVYLNLGFGRTGGQLNEQDYHRACALRWRYSFKLSERIRGLPTWPGHASHGRRLRSRIHPGKDLRRMHPKWSNDGLFSCRCRELL